MDTLNFFTTFRPTLAGAWIPAVFMVLVQFVCMAGVIIASASLWLLLMMVPYCWAMHGVILGEEKYCERTFHLEKTGIKRNRLWPETSLQRA